MSYNNFSNAHVVNIRSGFFGFSGTQDVWNNNQTWVKWMSGFGLALKALSLGTLATIGYKGYKLYVSSRIKKAEMANRQDTPTLVATKAPVESDMGDEVEDETVDSEITFLSNTCIPKGTRCIIFGPKKSGKTTFAVSLAACIRHGYDFGLNFGEEGKNADLTDVIYYDGEMTRSNQRQRYGNSGLDFHGIKRLHSFKFKNYEDFVEDLKNRVLSGDRDVCVFADNGKKIFGELKPEEVIKLDELLTEIQNEATQRGFSFTFVLLMHTPKDTKAGVSGSSNYENFFQNMIMIEKIMDNGVRRYKVTFENTRDLTDGQEFVIDRNPETGCMCYQSEEPEQEEFVEHYSQISEEGKKEILNLYSSLKSSGDKGNGFETVYKRLGKKYGFGSSKTLGRKIKEWLGEG